MLITDGGMIQVAQQCPQLESLNCCCCREITDITVLKLSEISRKLLKLNIGYNFNISPSAVFRLLSERNQLQALICIECPQIMPKFIAELMLQFPGVDINSALFI